MPLWKYLANRLVTMLENSILGQNLGGFHSGFRVHAPRVLETAPFEANSDDFVFDFQFLAQAAYFGFRIGDVPVPARYFAKASSISFRRSVTYGLGPSACWVVTSRTGQVSSSPRSSCRNALPNRRRFQSTSRA
jgi:hypothetical protein